MRVKDHKEMPYLTEQSQTWIGVFGQEYTDRNALSLVEMDLMYKNYYGVTRTALNQKFLGELPASVRILEAGSNVGNQLLCLQRMGFHNLYGIEIQSYAVELSKSRTQRINLIEASIFDIPYKNEYFDVVFTSGVLIHIHPDDLPAALREIHRCAKDYIWGLEYYADEYTSINYRGYENLLWKSDFVKHYLELFDDLELIKEERLHYLDNENIDAMFLLKKGKKR